jgi:hypothetical protein
MARRVLITGSRAAAALDLARDFAADGWEPHLADSVTSRMARWSKLAASHHRYPPPKQQGAAFRARICELVDQHRFDLVVPTCEEVFRLAAPSLHVRLGERLFAPALPTLRRLHDKFAFVEACRDWGLPAPESHLIEKGADLAPFASTSPHWVFKPRFSRFGDKAVIGPDRRSLEAIRPNAQTPWLAQRRVIGEEACFHAVAHRGTLVAFAAYGSQWRLRGGARYAFEPLPHAGVTMMRALAEQLARRGGLHGQFACDVMVDAAGAPFLLECNPRATSGVHLLAGGGQLARAIHAGVPAPDAPFQTAYLVPAMLLLGLPRALRRSDLAGWRACLAAGRDAISRPGDRAPLAGAVADAAAFFLGGLRHNISTNAATTRDIEWNGEELDR